MQTRSTTGPQLHVTLLSARYLRFLVVGALNAVVDLTVLNLLMWAHPTRIPWQLTVYNTIAVACAIVNSYLWNQRWTFRDVAAGTSREFGLYTLQALINVVINDAVLTAAAACLEGVRGLSPFWSSNLAKAAAMFLSSSVSYLCMRLFVFRRTKGVLA
jgi:putative flippase GtrA